MLKGGCFCGHVRYEVAGEPFHRTICHCTMCRRVAGSPMVAWFSVAKAEYRVVSGEPVRFASSARAHRTFCPRCGTPLTFESIELPEEIDITAVSLDDPEAVPPEDHTRTETRLSWVRLCDGLPSHRGPRPG